MRSILPRYKLFVSGFIFFGLVCEVESGVLINELIENLSSLDM